MYSLKRIPYSFFMISFCFLSCEKYLDIDPPNNRIESSAAFADSTSALSAIIGTYSDMMASNTGFIASQVRWASLVSDELGTSLTDNTEATEFLDNNLLPTNENLGILWNDLYKKIYQVNSTIEGMENSQTISPTAKKVLTGEAKFLRAFFFFYAASYWGDVPLVLTGDYRINEAMPRTPSQQVYEQIVTDLHYAVESLPTAYPAAEKVRPNRFAAMALLARVQLFLENWQEAADNSGQVILSGGYLPLPSLQTAFLKDSKETIWQLYPANSGTQETYEAVYFVPSSLTDNVIPNYFVTDNLYNSFEEKDGRKTQWIGSKISAGGYHFPYKYKVRSKSSATVPSEYTVVLRLSEQLLIRAESRLRLGDLKGAIEDLNTVRERAGLEALSTSLPEEDIYVQIEHERRHELFCEWGHRWLDLKRTKRADNVLRPIKGDNWQSTDVLWPLPINQLLTNPNLTQNEGY